MKQFVTELAAIVVIMVVMFILLLAVMFPFMMESANPPIPGWVGWVLYPVAIILLTLHSRIVNWLDGVMLKPTASKTQSHDTY